MKLINTDGMAFIGPGSEWFWTALSGIVLAVTFLAIYRQLRLHGARGRRADRRIAREWTSERTRSYRLSVLVALRDGADPAHLPDAAAMGCSKLVGGIGDTRRSRALAGGCSGTITASHVRRWWEIPRALGADSTRARRQDPAVLELEWLAAKMDSMDRRAGTAVNQSNEAVFTGVTGSRHQ